ncbi:MAG: hypothetical protein Q3999_05155 [Buchananella hordeovulneris]|nr:hypothetical protein [Buchananella hordeovulneris]
MSLLRRYLEDLCQWVGEIPDPHAARIGLRSSWPRRDSSRLGVQSQSDALPFRLEVALDSIESDGPAGIVSRGGLEDYLDGWRDVLSDALGLDYAMHLPPWRWLLLHVERIEAEYAHVGELVAQVATTHGVVARLAGRNPEQLGPCPRCCSLVMSWPGATGMIEPTCSGCSTVWRTPAVLHAEVAELHRERLRQSGAEQWVSRGTAVALHARLTRDNLRQLVRRGRVRARGVDLVDLGDVNRAMGTVVDAPGQVSGGVCA